MRTKGHTPPSDNRIASRRRFSPALTDKLLTFGVLLVSCTLLTVLRSAEANGTVCAWLTAVSVAVMFLLVLRSRRLVKPVYRHGLLPVTFGASMSAFLLWAAVGASIYFAHFAPTPATDESEIVSFLVNLFALLTAAYFMVASATNVLLKKKTAHLLLALTPIFFCALRVLNTFINHSTLPLAFGGGYRILGMIFAMLFFLNEGKLLLGMKTASAYRFTGFAATIFCATYDLPLLITVLRDGGSGPDAAYSLLTLGLVVYILCRLATLPAMEEKAE